MPLNRLGNYVRERRIDLGLTQEELADRIGGNTTQAEVSRLERGHIMLPRRDRLDALASALDVTLGSLLLNSGWLTPDERAVVDGQQNGQPKEQARGEPAVDASVMKELADLQEALLAAVEQIASLQALIRDGAEPAEPPKTVAQARTRDDGQPATVFVD
jgi:transcriptional regulator with XRE-family HTH domain